MTRYLITGGAGFIGSNIVAALVAQGAAVRVADNFSTGKRDNLKAVADKIELFEGDLAQLDFARDAAREVDYVIHQAAIPSVPRSVADPIETNDAGVTATLNMLVAARDAGAKRMTFASSSSIYGEAVAGAKHEGMMLDPLSPYGVSKMAAEGYCRAFHTVYGFETVCLRYFNVFGPRQDPASEYAAVIPKFITAMLAGKSPTIFGDGEQTRDFTFVGNVVAANLHALTASNAGGGYFNIAMGQATSLNQLVDMLNELIGANIRANHAPPRTGDIKHSTADVRKIREVLGYTPAVSLMDGLRQTIEWYRNSDR
ncbi:MAG: SDR family oxidoreductase [Chloroflexi bacterium]|nr:SDR family oxidoreductase [Chloroflexota bacterium]